MTCVSLDNASWLARSSGLHSLALQNDMKCFNNAVAAPCLFFVCRNSIVMDRACQNTCSCHALPCNVFHCYEYGDADTCIFIFASCVTGLLHAVDGHGFEARCWRMWEFSLRITMKTNSAPLGSKENNFRQCFSGPFFLPLPLPTSIFFDLSIVANCMPCSSIELNVSCESERPPVTAYMSV